jgi:hypothetical protein
VRAVLYYLAIVSHTVQKLPNVAIRLVYPLGYLLGRERRAGTGERAEYLASFVAYAELFGVSHERPGRYIGVPP